MNQLKFYSVFSGTFFEIPESHVSHMDCGQIPIKAYPTDKCKNCYGRGYVGLNTKSGHYEMCRCVIKLIEPERVVHKHVHDIQLDPKYNA